MATPSIALIPSGYKANKVYSVLPENGDGDFAFTRASEATRINEEGLIETMANGIPRLDYGSGTCPSLLLEPQSTNVLTYSEDFGNAVWTTNGSATITPNSGVSPDGTTTAVLFDSVSGGPNRMQQLYTGTRTGQFTASMYAKKVDSNKSTLRITEGGGIDKRVSFDFDNETISDDTTTPDDYGFEKLDNGWYRIWMTLTFTGGNVNVLINNAISSITGTQQYIWGVQLELDYPTSYIPTVASTVTRVGDLVNGAGSVDNFNSSEGVLYAEMSALVEDNTNKRITVSDGTNNNRIELRYNSDNTIVCILILSGVNQVTLQVGLDNLITHKFAFKYKQNDFSLFIDGVEENSSSSGNTFSSGTLNKLNFTSANGTSNPLYANLKDLRVYKTALTDSELILLTS